MVSISLCMIVKNEEEVLSRCLESVSGIFDEIIIIDTGSTDKTCEIASRYTDKIYEFKWTDDFSAARNYSFSKANSEYCMWLDADDIILAPDAESLIKLKNSIDNSVDVVMLLYNIDFDSNGDPIFFYYRERIIKNSSKFKWSGAVHEVITPSGKIIYNQTAVTHKKIKPTEAGRNLMIYKNLIKKGYEFTPRDKYYYGRELYYNNDYITAIKVLNEFLIEGKGWVEDSIESCAIRANCHALLNENDKSISALLESLKYGIPSAEICCMIGGYFFDKTDYKTAVFWYELANCEFARNKDSGFIKKDYQDFIPYLQLCVCHYRLGDMNKSAYYNQKAAEIKPDDPKVKYNRGIFNGEPP